MVERVGAISNQEVNGTSEGSEAYVGRDDEDYSMTFNAKDVADLAVPNVTTAPTLSKAQNGTCTPYRHYCLLIALGNNVTTFKTDADIAGYVEAGERVLIPWVGDTNSINPELTMEGSVFGDWDQFKENERRFGLKSDYTEEVYTTTIDTRNPLYKQRAAAAEQTARQIEAEKAKNPQERTSAEDDDLDEEDK